jgi:hypothetical protein
MRAAALFVGAFLLFCVGVWISIVRRGWMDGPRERRPTLREETPPDWNAPAPRPSIADLPLSERNARDQRIANAVVKRWRRKGLP